MKVKIYNTYDNKQLIVPRSDFNNGAIEMLKLIGKKEGWEETQDNYFKLFYEGLYESKNGKEM